MDDEVTEVTEARLRELWFSAEGVGLTLDHQLGMKIVALNDGRRFGTRFENCTTMPEATNE